ncbi:MAG: SLBB domain-containing protein [Gemmatimonadales bacterium]|nr:SLBB domain-containing protein [Gemmatimonadales bacterium]
MPIRASGTFRRPRSGLLLAVFLTAMPGAIAAQVPAQVGPGQQLPTPDQARDLLQNQPDLVRQLREKLGQSGLSPDQVRARLRAAGYPENFLDQYLSGADTSQGVRPGPRDLDAVQALGILSPQEADSLQFADSMFAISDSVRQLLDSLRYVHLDSLRADSLADSLEAIQPAGLKVFGLETFRRLSTRFEPMDAGPVDENYQLGPGDALVLILTGDVEQAHVLNVTREGFIVVPQVGQLHVANLTLGQLEDQLYTRLGKVYSGVRRSPDARTQFQVSLAKLRKLQVYVAGDVVRPGAYQVSAAGTVLNALYAAGGPTTNGSFRRIDIRRGGKLVDSVDVYDYLTQGINPTVTRLQTGDVVFVPVHGGFAKVAGKVKRPAIYELRPDETLRDLIEFAGGFDPTAYQARVTIHRVLPAASRGSSGRARVVIAVGADQFVDGGAPAVPMAPGDSVTVHGVADRIRSFVTVRGNVWVEGEVGHAPGMKLSDAIRLAGGPKPDVYLDRILVTRVRDDSSMIQLRSAFRDTTGAVIEDILLDEEDEIRVFSRSTFRAERYVAVVGAVRKPGRVPYREGMTVRDAVLLADGLTPDAWLQEAEIARLAEDSTPGALAKTIRVPLDSSYLFGRRPGDKYAGPPGLPAPASGAPDAELQPYDNLMVMRQPGWELQRSVAITGQVRYPGRYSLKSKTDRLNDLLVRAGGLTPQAYPAGVQFYRSYTGGRPTGGDPLTPVLAEPRPYLTVGGRDSVRRSVPERVGIDLPKVLADSGFRDNIVLLGGDSLHIPEFDPVIMVQGAVNSPGPVAYEPGKNLDWYVDRAGGYTQTGDQGHAYLTQPNGEREGVKRRAVFADRVPRPRPGAVVFVPNKLLQEQPSNVTGVLATAAQVIGALVTIILVARR